MLGVMGGSCTHSVVFVRHLPRGSSSILRACRVRRKVSERLDLRWETLNIPELVDEDPDAGLKLWRFQGEVKGVVNMAVGRLFGCKRVRRIGPREEREGALVQKGGDIRVEAIDQFVVRGEAWWRCQKKVCCGYVYGPPR